MEEKLNNFFFLKN